MIKYGNNDIKKIICNGKLCSIQHVATRPYVDLGLPSGTMWAKCNLGANYPEEFGDYYKYGAVYPEDSGSESSLLNIQDTNYDAAKYVLGDGWMIPLQVQFRELLEYCEWVSYIMNGISGWLVTSNINGKDIFIPSYNLTISTFLAEPTSTTYWDATWIADRISNTFFALQLSGLVGINSLPAPEVASWSGSGSLCFIRPVYIL